jgi:nucleotide-binding universal stress UspA family protein
MTQAIPNIKHILFPVDFSDRSCGAVPFVAQVAKRFNAKVTLLSVAQPFWYAGMGEPSYPVMFDTDTLKSDLQARLETIFLKELEGIRVERLAELGDPADVIIQFAHNTDVDLIMMPTHGYGPFRRLLLGSVTAKVLHDAHCPVWTGAHVEERPMQQHQVPKTILCAVDATAKSIPLIQWAADYAKGAGATLRLVHAVPGVEAWPERQLDREFEETLRREARVAVEALEKEAGVEAPLCVTLGGVAGVMGEEAQRHGADLLIVGRGLIHETLGRLRTHAHAIIRHAPCPVISV